MAKSTPTITVVLPSEPVSNFDLGIGLLPEQVPRRLVKGGRDSNWIRTPGDPLLMSRARKVSLHGLYTIGITKYANLDMLVAAAILMARAEGVRINRRILADLRVRILIGPIAEDEKRLEPDHLRAAVRISYIQGLMDSPLDIPEKVSMLAKLITNRLSKTLIHSLASAHELDFEKVLETFEDEPETIDVTFDHVAIGVSPHKLASHAALHKGRMSLILNPVNGSWTICWDNEFNCPVNAKSLYEELATLEQFERIKQDKELNESLVWNFMPARSVMSSPAWSGLSQDQILLSIRKHLK